MTKSFCQYFIIIKFQKINQKYLKSKVYFLIFLIIFQILFNTILDCIYKKPDIKLSFSKKKILIPFKKLYL